MNKRTVCILVFLLLPIGLGLFHRYVHWLWPFPLERFVQAGVRSSPSLSSEEMDRLQLRIWKDITENFMWLCSLMSSLLLGLLGTKYKLLLSVIQAALMVWITSFLLGEKVLLSGALLLPLVYAPLFLVFIWVGAGIGNIFRKIFRTVLVKNVVSENGDSGPF